MSNLKKRELVLHLLLQHHLLYARSYSSERLASVAFWQVALNFTADLHVLFPYHYMYSIYSV